MIAVLIPTYEPKKEHLKAALDSLLAQNFKDWTCLIHDDCSSVDVKEMVESYLSDTRFTFIRSDVRLGIGSNWNACLNCQLSIVNCQFTQFLFQDDLWHPNYLEKAITAANENPSAGLIAVNHDYSFETPDREHLYEYATRVRDEEMKEGLNPKESFLWWWMERGLKNVVGEPSFVLLRRSVMEKTGNFREDMVQFLDAEMWLRMLQISDLYFIKEKLGTFRVHATGTSAAQDQSGSGLFERFETFANLIPTLPARDCKRAKKLLKRSVTQMVQTYMERRRTGKTTPVHGNGTVKRFAFRHPLLMTKALMASLLKQIR